MESVSFGGRISWKPRDLLQKSWKYFRTETCSSVARRGWWSGRKSPVPARRTQSLSGCPWARETLFIDRTFAGIAWESCCTCIVFTASTCTFEVILSIYIHYNDFFFVKCVMMLTSVHDTYRWRTLILKYQSLQFLSRSLKLPLLDNYWISINLCVVDSVWSSWNSCCSVVCSKAERGNGSSTLSDVNRWYVMSSRRHPKSNSPVPGVISSWRSWCALALMEERTSANEEWYV